MRSFDLVWQSRSGPPRVPWLEPDINDHLRSLAGDGVTSVVVAPTGFVSDHLEVLWDLDNEAPRQRATSASRWLGPEPRARTRRSSTRSATSYESAWSEPNGKALGPMGPSWDECPFDDGCCTARTVAIA